MIVIWAGGSSGCREAKGRTAEELHIRISATDETVQLEAKLHQVQGSEGRDHQRPGSHHPGASRSQVAKDRCPPVLEK